MGRKGGPGIGDDVVVGRGTGGGPGRGGGGQAGHGDGGGGGRGRGSGRGAGTASKPRQRIRVFHGGLAKPETIDIAALKARKAAVAVAAPPAASPIPARDSETAAAFPGGKSRWTQEQLEREKAEAERTKRKEKAEARRQALREREEAERRLHPPPLPTLPSPPPAPTPPAPHKRAKMPKDHRPFPLKPACQLHMDGPTQRMLEDLLLLPQGDEAPLEGDEAVEDPPEDDAKVEALVEQRLAARRPAKARPRAVPPASPQGEDDSLEHLVEMGFRPRHAAQALVLSGGAFGPALDWLVLNTPPDDIPPALRSSGASITMYRADPPVLSRLTRAGFPRAACLRALEEAYRSQYLTPPPQLSFTATHALPPPPAQSPSSTGTRSAAAAPPCCPSPVSSPAAAALPLSTRPRASQSSGTAVPVPAAVPPPPPHGFKRPSGAARATPPELPPQDPAGAGAPAGEPPRVEGSPPLDSASGGSPSALPAAGDEGNDVSETQDEGDAAVESDGTEEGEGDGSEAEADDENGNEDDVDESATSGASGDESNAESPPAEPSPPPVDEARTDEVDAADAQMLAVAIGALLRGMPVPFGSERGVSAPPSQSPGARTAAEEEEVREEREALAAIYAESFEVRSDLHWHVELRVDVPAAHLPARLPPEPSVADRATTVALRCATDVYFPAAASGTPPYPRGVPSFLLHCAEVPDYLKVECTRQLNAKAAELAAQAPGACFVFAALSWAQEGIAAVLERPPLLRSVLPMRFISADATPHALATVPKRHYTGLH